MPIAIPLSSGVLAEHFGHSGLLPLWWKQHGVTTGIAGSMGSRARMLFADAAIEANGGIDDRAMVEVIRDQEEKALWMLKATLP